MIDPQSLSPLTSSVQAVAAERGLQWLVSGWRLFLKAPGVWLGITVVLLVATLLLIIMPQQFDLSLLSMCGQFAIAFLMPVVTAGLLGGCRSLMQGEALHFADIFAGFKQNTRNLLIVGVLSLLGHAAIGLLMVGLGGNAMPAVEPGALPALGGMLFALLLGTLLLLPLAMALWFAPALVMFHHMGPVAALKCSFIGCLKNTLPFLIYGIVGLVLLLMVIPTFGLGLLVLIPVIVGSVYASYCDVYTAPFVTPTSTSGT